MTTDPTHSEMMQTLSPDSESYDDAEIAIYWFANDWHGGQHSNLYSALSTSIYKPGPTATLDSEGEIATLFYDQIEQAFT